MATKKVLFVAQEITPYVPLSDMSKMGKEIPQYVQEHGCQIRIFHPKWGIINERRNQLHDVIRLSGMNIIIDDTDHPLIIKVASLQSAHMQVYFIDNNDFFKKRQMAADKDGEEYDDNYERAVFYARSVIETTKLLHWNPDVVQCQGWISAFVPFYLKTAYSDEPCFAGAKTVLALHGVKLTKPLPDNFVDMLAFRDISAKKIKGYKMPLKAYDDLLRFAIRFSDAVVCFDGNIDPSLVEYAKQEGKAVLEYSADDFPEKVKAFYDSLN